MRLLTGRALLFVLGLALFESGAGAQLFTNLASLVYQIRDPFLGGDTAGPKAVATADFDADGKTDLAVANTDGSVSVFFGQGGGRFSLAKHLVTGASSLRGILCADLN